MSFAVFSSLPFLRSYDLSCVSGKKFECPGADIGRMASVRADQKPEGGSMEIKLFCVVSSGPDDSFQWDQATWSVRSSLGQIL